MQKTDNDFVIVDVSSDNVDQEGVCCVKNKNAPGYKAKLEWFKSEFNKGLKIKIAKDSNGNSIAFIEYIPAEIAWRPVKADNYIFIHCIANYSKKERNKGLVKRLIQECEIESRKLNKSGVCVMTSNGTWMADKSIFEKSGYFVASKSGRFELMYKRFHDEAPIPEFQDIKQQEKEYSGWNIVYSDQCPWHVKSVTDLQEAALENDIELLVHKIKTPEEAKKAPSGFGTFTLLKDNKVLEDHYISKTRFLNILKKNK